MIKKLLCRCYEFFDDHWSPFLEHPDQPLVRLIDLFSSSCKYCTAYRALVVGGSIAVMLPIPWWLGPLGLAVCAFLVIIERAACGRY